MLLRNQRMQMLYYLPHHYHPGGCFDWGKSQMEEFNWLQHKHQLGISPRWCLPMPVDKFRDVRLPFLEQSRLKFCIWNSSHPEKVNNIEFTSFTCGWVIKLEILLARCALHTVVVAIRAKPSIAPILNTLSLPGRVVWLLSCLWHPTKGRRPCGPHDRLTNHAGKW